MSKINLNSSYADTSEAGVSSKPVVPNSTIPRIANNKPNNKTKVWGTPNGRGLGYAP